MASLAPSSMLSVTTNNARHKHVKLCKSQVQPNGCNFLGRGARRLNICCTNESPWEPPAITYASIDKPEQKFLPRPTSIFESVSSNEATEASATKEEEVTSEVEQNTSPFQYVRWPMWLLGPAILLVTGMVPTLWLPLSSVFIGPNIASLLSLTGLDCIFNLGASLFLLMADSCAHYSKTKTRGSSSTKITSKPPFSYQFWNMVANAVGFIVPLIMLYGSHKAVLLPQMSFLPFAVLLGPYLLLLSVQILTEALTWHWQSPVWLVTPVIYEGYRLLQIMRGLKLGAELAAPSWMMNTIRGLVCWWVLILGVQLMRVAWFAGFTARSQRKQSSLVASGSD
ncbi:hypothetical protein LIER_10510 [Lithospermum erythrorhizon]|uniref:Transmembrane protein n=1 Tax=Lithospermum erythrorhizon TaxID=34254 RepID=A0AAV3PJK1_LITER